jgi:hypothetical protein
VKFERKHRNIIILAIATFFILYGLLDMKFDFNINEELEDKASWILTIIAVALLFSGTKPKLKNLDEEKNNSISDNVEGNQGDTIDTANSIEDNSEIDTVENSDKLIDGTIEQDKANDTENKDN